MERLTKLIDNIDKGESLSNADYKLIRNSSKNLKDSSA